MYSRSDGIVDFDKNACIGCKACIAACPYDAIFINPDDHCAEKCNFCAHRLDVGLEPACVVVCPTEAIVIGDLSDPTSKIAQLVHREPVTVRRPEKDTSPKLFYIGATQATLDPIAARRPDGGMFIWGEQFRGDHAVVSGAPPEARRNSGSAAVGRHSGANNSAAAVLAWDVPHRAPWDWRVSAYTVTKGIAAGAALVAALLAALGVLAGGAFLATAVPLLALVFLAITGGLLIADLEQPQRFWYILARPQWRSWLTRGAVILGVFGAGLAAWCALGLAGLLPTWIPLALAPVALATAGYTAFLFAQSKARDLWQSPLLLPHLTVEAFAAGAAALALLAALLEPHLLQPLGLVLAISSGLHLALGAGECVMPHATAHARLAVAAMTRGRYRRYLIAGFVGIGAGVLAPWIGPTIAAPLVLAGLFCWEHAFVQAGQSIPLA
jgi:ferredoxin